MGQNVSGHLTGKNGKAGMDVVPKRNLARISNEYNSIVDNMNTSCGRLFTNISMKNVRDNLPYAKLFP